MARPVNPPSCVWRCILLGNLSMLHDLSAIPDVIRQQSLRRRVFDGEASVCNCEKHVVCEQVATNAGGNAGREKVLAVNNIKGPPHFQ